jgi:gas vesicle protein
MLRREESRHDFAFMTGVIVGALAGAITALALTPLSGSEAREKLRAHSGDLGVIKERALAAASTAKEKAEPVREKAAGVASSALEKVEPVKGKAMELAAKSPLPVGKTTTVDGEVTTDVTLPPIDTITTAATEG